MLQMAIEAGFNANLQDKNGQTPYQLALKQNSGVLAAFLKDNNKIEVSQEDQHMIIEQIVFDNDKPDYEADSHAYLNEIQMQIDPHKYVPCDPSGKFSDDCVVIFDDGCYQQEDPINNPNDEEMKENEAAEIPLKGTQQHFDVYLTRVQIGKF